jgi:hypothetical protein
MSIVLRILAGMVMVVGVACVGFVLYRLSDDRVWQLVYNRGYFIGGLCLGALCLGGGGVLWALLRLADCRGGSSISAAGIVPAARPVLMPGILRVLGAVQIGTGLLVSGVFYYRLQTAQIGDDPWGNPYWLLLVAAGSWGFACLGGILLALTRIAYPPTTIAPDSRSST